MRLKTKLVLAITSLVLFISSVLALVYLSQLLHVAVQQSYIENHMLAEQLRLELQSALETGLRGRTVNPNNPSELRDLTAAVIRNNEDLQSAIIAVNRYAATVSDVSITDSQSTILLSNNPDNNDHLLPTRPGYDQLLNASFVRLIREAFGPPRVYDIVASLDRNGVPFVSVHIGARTTLLRAEYTPWITTALSLMGFSLITTLVAAFLLSNIALRPIEQISHQLDFLTADESSRIAANKNQRQDAVEQVSSKIQIIGQRMKNVQEVFSSLKGNIDQILGNMQDGILLLTADGRAVLASESVHHFLALKQANLLGMQATEIFNPSTILGKTLRDAYDAHIQLIREDIQTENDKHVQVSLDFIYEDESQQGLGALVTLHDLESAKQIESELEISRRMAAIGRLTSGVGHEVKNPINAIVVHLELLKNKLGSEGGPAANHLSIIDSEIRRLDRVVQTLVDFSRPVDLRLFEQDLRNVVSDVLALSAAELSTRNVTLSSHIPESPLNTSIDKDLIKQAMLNVIQNGAQAMPNGGRLTVKLREDKKFAALSITDEGDGIPDEIREKIFDLYFTTKSEGSGIGLAMTYRIMQLHNGSVEVQSKKGQGTEFTLRIPLITHEQGRRGLQATASHI